MRRNGCSGGALLCYLIRPRFVNPTRTRPNLGFDRLGGLLRYVGRASPRRVEGHDARVHIGAEVAVGVVVHAALDEQTAQGGALGVSRRRRSSAELLLAQSVVADLAGRELGAQRRLAALILGPQVIGNQRRDRAAPHLAVQCVERDAGGAQAGLNTIIPLPCAVEFHQAQPRQQRPQGEALGQQR